MTAEIPIISILESDADCFSLMATSYDRTMPAGQRLFRGKPHPEIIFTHPTKSAAEKAAIVLQNYINEHWNTKITKYRLKKDKRMT